MLPLVLVVGLLSGPSSAAGASASVARAAGSQPAGALADLHDLSRLALLRDPTIQPIQVDSFTSDGSAVFQAEGPGVIRRLGFEADPTADRVHLRVVLDGEPEPALDLSLGELVSGRHPRFPRPLVGQTSGVSWCYVPIAFRDGCRIEVEGLGGRALEIDAVRLPTAEGVVSFSATLSEEEWAELQRAGALWSRPGDRAALHLPDHEVAQYRVDALARTSLTFALPSGPRTIRSFEVEPTPDTADAWLAARLRLVWDDDDPSAAGVDLPLGLFLGQAEGLAPYRSLITGRTERSWFHHLPMPYRRQGRLRIDTARPIRGTVRLVTVACRDPRAGYLRVSRHDEVPTRLKARDQGDAGHLVGMIQVRDDDAPASAAVVSAPSEGRVRALSQHGQAASRLEYRWRVADPVPLAGALKAPRFGEAPAHDVVLFWYSPRSGPRD